MKNTTNIIKCLLVFCFVTFSSCETLDMNQTENPSTLNEKFLDPIFTFNYVQINLPDFVDSANQFTQRVTRQMAMTGGNNYDNAFQPINFNNNWSTGYNILNAIKIMEPKAIEKNEIFVLGASKLIRVYILMTLVDMYGDIPYSEALQGNANLFPKYDNDADVYKGLLGEIDEAITILKSNSGNPNKSESVTNLYYSTAKNWITLANTLKLKMLNNVRLAGADLGLNIATEMTSIYTANDIIDRVDEDFLFQYGSSRFTPNTRHPLYNDQYELGGGAYIGNYMFWTMTTEKGWSSEFGANITPTNKRDPRTNFYFYKQDGDTSGETDFTLPGRNRVRPAEYANSQYQSFYNPSIKTPFTISNWVAFSLTGPNGPLKPSNGYWGRDHGNNDGIPTDNDKRSVGGFYPIGGIYDKSAKSVQTGGDKGALGAGVMPIIMSSYVHFILAEAMVTNNIPGGVSGAKAEFLLGIDTSIGRTIKQYNSYPNINRDMPFPNSADAILPPGTVVRSNTTGLNITLTSSFNNYSTLSKINLFEIPEYKTFMGNFYDGLTSDAKKLELIIKEYYIASWGNGIEPYNNYRRTGYPSNFQPTIEPISGEYFYTAYYPASAVNNNPNTPKPNERTRRVFWDKANLNLN